MDNSKSKGKTKCILCGVHSIKNDFVLPNTKTFFLKETVVICDKCFVKKLTDLDIDWDENIKNLLSYDL
jgi:hypothetical protein